VIFLTLNLTAAVSEPLHLV